MGVKIDADDDVCGPCGVQHQNAAGRKLKSLAGMQGLRDLISRQPQKFYGAWHDMDSGNPHQLDNAFMKVEDIGLVKKCTNAVCIVNSDHASIHLHLHVLRKPDAPKTIRQTRAALTLGIHEWLHDCEENERDELAGKAAGLHLKKKLANPDSDEFATLMGVVSEIIADGVT
jgi:hypothetical protein